MINYSFGHYGFLQQGKLKNPPLVLQDFGVERRCKEAYHYENAQRTSYGGYLLQYTLRGLGIYETDEKLPTGTCSSANDSHDAPFPLGSQKYELHPGQGFFARMPENSRYYLPAADISADTAAAGWEFFYLHFSGPAAAPFFETVRRLTGPVFSLDGSSPPIHLFFQLFDRCCRNESRALYEDGEFLYRFLTQLLRELETPSTGVSPLVRQASGYFKDHFSDIRGIGDAAEVCQVSQEHLTRAFRRETGQTPLQYLTKLRIEHSLFLLLNTRDSIESVAVACGFLNGNYFAKVFRRYLNCSPEEYRKRNRC